ncbi:hypothetical protein JRO89_XS06G0032000 [Xanthoceras sorbifolium]|uniref:Uncharacterized protein n=1 Tax=Xanthoceras sorbifolium TaxID=99658 RepID=A0ABQ8HWI3_9ROSI|nr:hypothetical protein JRO89_XS06G0032000 [Xanthoceras sorbifolium]
MELVDQNLGFEFDKVEAERMIKVALLCANASPSLRPTTSEVCLRDKRNRCVIGSYQHQPAPHSGPSSTHDVPEVNAEKYLKFKAMRDSRLQWKDKTRWTKFRHQKPLHWTGSSSEPAHDLHYTI